MLGGVFVCLFDKSDRTVLNLDFGGDFDYSFVKIHRCFYKKVNFTVYQFKNKYFKNTMKMFSTNFYFNI